MESVSNTLLYYQTTNIIYLPVLVFALVWCRYAGVQHLAI